jgi:uncharacterized membrane protein
LTQRTRDIDFDSDPQVAPDSVDRWMGAIAYVTVFCFVPYLLRPDHPYPRFHAKQGILLLFLEVVAGLALWVIEITIGQIPFLGLLILVLARLAIWLPILGLAVLGFTRALAGETLPLPWIGRYDEIVPDPPDLAQR